MYTQQYFAKIPNAMGTMCQRGMFMYCSFKQINLFIIFHYQKPTISLEAIA